MDVSLILSLKHLSLSERVNEYVSFNPCILQGALQHFVFDFLAICLPTKKVGSLGPQTTACPYLSLERIIGVYVSPIHLASSLIFVLDLMASHL